MTTKYAIVVLYYAMPTFTIAPPMKSELAVSTMDIPTVRCCCNPFTYSSPITKPKNSANQMILYPVMRQLFGATQDSQE